MEANSMNTTVKQITRLLEMAVATYEKLYETASVERHENYRTWLIEVREVLKDLPNTELSVKGAENFKTVPDGYVFRDRLKQACATTSLCSLKTLKQYGGCRCLEPIAAPLNSGSAKEENNGSNQRIWEVGDPTPLVEKLNDWKQLGKAARTIIAEVYRTGDAKSVFGVNYHEWLNNYEYLEGDKSEQECTIKGTELAASWRDRIRSLEKQMAAISKRLDKQIPINYEEWKGWSTHWVKEIEAVAERMKSAGLRVAGVDSTVAKFIGSTNRILNDLRKDVNEVLAEKNSNLQRIEKLEEILYELQFDNSQKKANLEEIITKLRTL